MDSWDCAAAMLERYIAKPPNIKGCPVDVQRSNYDDLQPKFEVSCKNFFFSAIYAAGLPTICRGQLQ